MQLVKPDTLFLNQLHSIVGPAGTIHPTDAEKYFIDLRGQFIGSATLIVRPSTTLQVSQILTACNAACVGIVPFGGGTGGAAGHIDTGENGVIVMSFERMAAIRSINTEDNVLLAEAGCVLADLQNYANKHNRRFGLSLASEGSCTIGGNLASNAGGMQVLKYGNARDLCLGIEAVMPDGSILNDANALRKNNTGYDLRHLLIGSEGTLGIITAASLKLSPRPEQSTTLMCAVASPAAAVALLQTIINHIGEAVSAFELMSELGIALATKHFPHARNPFNQNHQWYVLMEIEGHQEVRARLEDLLTRQLERDTIVDIIVAQSDTQSQALWELRELAYEYNRKEGVIYSSDTSVPISQIQHFIQQTVTSICNFDPDLRINCYGHIGDGNIHVNVFAPGKVAKQIYQAKKPGIKESLHRIINELTLACEGSISAEHGIGRLKTEDMTRYGDPTKLAIMKTIKQALDPKGIMNPGALFRL
jgi:D-lactate dehydrogenase (cytochrome)